MADRYWVGGSGTWNTSSTTNWSTSSGGASGASAPTASDNVFFDSNSNVGTGGFTVTVSAAVCNDFNAPGASTALDGAMTLAFASSTLTVSGSWTNQATNFAVTNTAGTLTFNATTTGKTITTNGVTIGVNTTLNGVGGAWTLGSALNISTSTLALTNGTFDTSASNYAVTAGAFSSNNSNTRTINLNGSTLTFSIAGTVWNVATSTNATLNAGTSTINLSSTSPIFSGGGLTYYNVSFTSTTATTVTKSITGANTFNNLTFSAIASAGLNNISIGANQTIDGTLTVNGSNGNRRMFVRSDAIGTTRTLTCAAIAAMTDVDFRDITIAGAAGTLSGTRLGDCGGNSNITFVAGANKYWNLLAGGNWNVTAWATSSGGSVADTNFPLAQDTAIIENTGLITSATITINGAWNIGTLDSSTRTNAMTLASSTNTPTFYGDFTYGSGVTPTGTGTYTFSNRSTKTLNSGGKTFTQPITINAPSGGIQLVTNNLTLGTTLTTFLTQGTLDLNNLTLTTGSFSSSNSNTRTIAFGTGDISCSGTGNVCNIITGTNLTTTGTQVINVTSAGSTAISVAAAGLSEANAISFNFTGGTYALSFAASSNTVRNLNFTGYAGTLTEVFLITVYGNLTLSTGMSLTASTFAWTFGATSGTQQITTNGKTLDFPITFNGVGGTFSLQDAMTLGSTRTMTLTNGTLNLNGKTCTVGIRFTTAAGTKNLTFNGGTLVCPNANTTSFNNAQPTNFTTTAGTGTGTISMTAATAKTFVGGGSTYNCTLNQGGAGDLTITGSNTFDNITNTVQPASVLFTAGTTSTFLSGFSLSGTAGNLITIGSATAASHTLSKASGTVSVSFCSISYSSATGGAIWQALPTNGNVDGGNNTGWSFGGTTYASLISEASTAVDSVLSRPTFRGSISEAATAADSLLVAPSTFNAPVLETSTATDSLLVAPSTFNAPVLEASTAADSVSSAADFSGSISEDATAADSVLSAANFYAVLAETATATDSLLVAPSTFNAPVFETSTAADSVLSFVDFYSTVFETATTTDSVLSAADFYVTLAEAATATDSTLVAPSIFNAPVTETTTATDTVSPPGSIYNVPILEIASISDLVLGAYLWNLIDDSQTVAWQNINSSQETVWSPIDTNPNTNWSAIPTIN